MTMLETESCREASPDSPAETILQAYDQTVSNLNRLVTVRQETIDPVEEHKAFLRRKCAQHDPKLRSNGTYIGPKVYKTAHIFKGVLYDLEDEMTRAAAREYLFSRGYNV